MRASHDMWWASAAMMIASNWMRAAGWDVLALGGWVRCGLWEGGWGFLHMKL